MLAERGQDERGDRDRLQRDEQRDEIARARHDAHAEGGDEQQEVELTVVVVALGDVVDREQHRDVRRDDEERLQRKCVVADHVGAVEETPLVAGMRERRDGDERAEQAHRGDARRAPRLAVGQDQVGEEHHDHRRDQHEVGREGVPIEGRGRDVRGRSEQHVSPR